MPRPRQAGLTENEFEVMQILWVKSPLKVAEILEQLRRKPKPAYTSLLTLVHTMEKKGYVKHKKEGKAFFYLPILQQKKYLNIELKRVISRLFAGNAGQLVLNLVKNEKLDPAEIEHLKQLLKDS